MSNKKFIVYTILLQILLNNFIFSYNKLNDSLFKFNKNFPYEKYFQKIKITLYASEFLTDELVIYSTQLGLFLLNIKTGEQKDLIKINAFLYEGFIIRDKEEKWGGFHPLQRINNHEFYFYDIYFPYPKQTGWFKYDIITNKIIHVRNSGRPPAENQPDNYNIKKLKLKTKDYQFPMFDPLGRYVFVFDVAGLRKKKPEPDISLHGDYYRSTLDGKEKKLLLEYIPRESIELSVITNKFILIPTYSGNVIIDYNGNILQWYHNFVFSCYSISPDEKHIIVCGAIFNSSKNEGLLLLDIDENVLKELIKYSKSLENLSDDERLKKNAIMNDRNITDRYRTDNSADYIGDKIYKVRL